MLCSYPGIRWLFYPLPIANVKSKGYSCCCCCCCLLGLRPHDSDGLMYAFMTTAKSMRWSSLIASYKHTYTCTHIIWIQLFIRTGYVYIIMHTSGARVRGVCTYLSTLPFPGIQIKNLCLATVYAHGNDTPLPLLSSSPVKGHPHASLMYQVSGQNS